MRLFSIPLSSLAALGAAMLAGAALQQAVVLRRALRRGRRTVAKAQGFECRPPSARRRVLVLGDSTGVGVGADDPRASLAGLLGADFPDVLVVNRAFNGARVADVAAQVASALATAHQPFDLALLHIGGNDVIRGGLSNELPQQVESMLDAVVPSAQRVVWLGTANIGLAPVFVAPFSWWLSHRTRRARRLFAQAARRRGVAFVDFFHEKEQDLFSRDAVRYFARDGLHPSGSSYRHCWNVVKRHAVVSQLLGRRLRQVEASA